MMREDKIIRPLVLAFSRPIDSGGGGLHTTLRGNVTRTSDTAGSSHC